jgi:hypothetical protein
MASLGKAVASGVFGAASAGIVIACLTLSLNPQIHARLADALKLIAIFFFGYATIGCIVGAAFWLALEAVLALTGRDAGRILESALLGVLGLGPLLYAASLPDLGLAGNVLTVFIFSPGIVGKALALAIVVLLLGGAAVAFRPAASRLRQRTGLSTWVLAAVLLSVTLGVAFLWALAGAGAAAATISPAAADDHLLPSSPVNDEVPPVVLLCIDGADLDDVVLPMVESGELPSFARLMAEGSWGELATFAPTLSPAIWTTLVTGKTKAEHGIHGFTVFQLPGMEAAVLEFPLHTGLNFELPPLIEKLPGMPPMRLPYTSDMRRAPALWNIAGRYYTVGFFHWRTTWPVERVNGFGLAEAVTLGETARGPRKSRNPSLSRQPPDVLYGLAPPPGLPDFEAVRPYLAPGETIDATDGMVQFIRSSMNRYTVHQLGQLIARHQPRFVAAAFYSVDGFNHYFGVDHVRGGRFAPAVAERYRFADARLEELIEALGPEVNLIVVSDHGYDFVNNNHTHAPPGIFFARGPAFEAGRRVAGLNVFDIAPLVLQLLGLPPGEDMPSVASRSYLAALDPTYAESHVVAPIGSWGSNEYVALRPRTDGEEQKILEELRSLGYIE